MSDLEQPARNPRPAARKAKQPAEPSSAVSADFTECEKTVLAMLTAFKKRNPELSRNSLNTLGEYVFNLLAIASQDPARWKTAQELQMNRDAQRHKNRQTRLQAEKLKMEVAQMRGVLTSPVLSADEKEQRVKQILGIA